MVNTALWAQRNPGKANDMEERFGVNVRNGAGYKSDSGETYEEYRESSDWHSKMTNAARNDYDLRRTLEAAAMSGKGKAKKILDKGFNNLEDVSKAMNFSEKAAKRHGQGGDFSSNSDYMGLTQSMVERDRRKQTKSYDAKYATNDALEEAMAKVKSGGTQEVKPPAKSEQTLKDEATVKNWDDNYSDGGIYGKNKAQADNFLAGYKKDLFQDKAALMPEF